jgi:ParB family chromosome partitioning protein
MATTGTLEHLDPSAVQIEENIRTTIATDKGLVSSIRENGVLVQVLGWRDADGTVHVRAGQRRALAACEAGVATIPVYIVHGSSEDDARRLIEQMVENEQRERLTDVERVKAWQQMELAGLSVTTIARKTGAKRERIKTGLAIAGSHTATTLVGDHGITLDQAAILLDFDGDEKTISDLTQIATEQPDYFPVAVERARQERAASRARGRPPQRISDRSDDRRAKGR